MEAQQQLFGLMAVAEEHQKAIKAAIDGLTAELAALAKERTALSQAIPGIRKAAGEAVGLAVTQSLAEAAETAATALETATKPILGKLSGVVRAAGEVEGKLRNAGAWFAWKWVAVAAGGMAGACLLAWASILWQRHQVESLTEEKAALQVEVAELKTGVAALAKKGGRIKITDCGPDNRLCVEITSAQGADKRQADFQGSWVNNDGSKRFVIPKGY